MLRAKQPTLLLSIAALFALTGGCVRSVGDTKYVGSVTLPGGTPCPDIQLASLPVSVRKTSRLNAYGSGIYNQNESNLNLVTLHIELLDVTNKIVGVTNRVPVSAPYSGPVSSNNGRAFVAVNGLVYAGSDFLSVTLGNGNPYVVPPGNYTLKLMLQPASSPCIGQSFVTFISLSYLLLDPSS
jgi:hypothetical protein